MLHESNLRSTRRFLLSMCHIFTAGKTQLCSYWEPAAEQAVEALYMALSNPHVDGAGSKACTMDLMHLLAKLKGTLVAQLTAGACLALLWAQKPANSQTSAALGSEAMKNGCDGVFFRLLEGLSVSA